MVFLPYLTNHSLDKNDFYNYAVYVNYNSFEKMVNWISINKLLYQFSVHSFSVHSDQLCSIKFKEKDDLDKFQSHFLNECYSSVEISPRPYKEIESINQWCIDNHLDFCNKDFGFPSRSTYVFKNQKDAAIFKMTWC